MPGFKTYIVKGQQCPNIWGRLRHEA